MRTFGSLYRLERLTVIQLVKKFPALWNRGVHDYVHRPPLDAILHQLNPTLTFTLYFLCPILIIPSHLRLLFPYGQVLWRFPTKILYVLVISLCVLYVPLILSLLFNHPKVGPVINVASWICVHYLMKHHAMKTYWESGGIAPQILNLGTMWRWEVSFTPGPLYPRYPFNRRLGGSHSRSGRWEIVENSCPKPQGNRPSGILRTDGRIDRKAI
jgi:hypothetical protein